MWTRISKISLLGSLICIEIYIDLSAGIVNFKFKDFKAAVEDLSTCVQIDRDNKSAYTYLVSVWYQTLPEIIRVFFQIILYYIWENMYSNRAQRCLQLVNTKGLKMHIRSPLNWTRIFWRHGFTWHRYLKIYYEPLRL